MAYTVTITYDKTKVKTTEGERVGSQVCDVFVPGGCAADSEAFEGTYYDTNTTGAMEAAMSLEDYVAAQIPHPGIAAAINKAIENCGEDGTGTYVYTTDEPMADIFVESVGKSMEIFGITIEAEEASAAEEPSKGGE